MIETNFASVAKPSRRKMRKSVKVLFFFSVTGDEEMRSFEVFLLCDIGMSQGLGRGQSLGGIEH